MTSTCVHCHAAIRLTEWGWGHIANPGRSHHRAVPVRLLRIGHV